MGIETWGSFEPVVFALDTLFLMKEVAAFTDMLKVGKLNHHEASAGIDWKRFAREVKDTLDSLGKRYYIKKDLAAYLENDK